MVYKIHQVHDSEHDPSLDDTFANAGVLTLVNNKLIKEATFIATGRNPKASNIAVKIQSLQYSQSYSCRDQPLVVDIDGISLLPNEWHEKIFFIETDEGSGEGIVAEPHISLKIPALSANTIPNTNKQKLLKDIDNGVILCAHAPGYANHIKDMVKLGADYSNSILIVQGAINENELFSTYNEKYGWLSLEERKKYFEKFKSVYIHDRNLANKLFLLDTCQLYELGKILQNQMYRDNAETYVEEATCGIKSISFFKTGPLTASRQLYAINNALWDPNGPYGPTSFMLCKLAKELKKEGDGKNLISFEELEYNIRTIISSTNSKVIMGESQHPFTEKGIVELHEFYKNNNLNDRPTPLAFRVLLIIYIVKGNHLVPNNEESIINYLKKYCKRTIFDPISLFIIHHLIKSEDSKLYNLEYKNIDDNKGLVDIQVKNNEYESAFHILLKLLIG